MNAYEKYKKLPEEVRERNKQFYTKAHEEYVCSDEIYISVLCPKCDKKNWNYVGRRDRYTSSVDGEACRCRSCSHEFWMLLPEFILEVHGDEFERCDGDLQKLIHECVGVEAGRRKAPWKRKA